MGMPVLLLSIKREFARFGVPGEGHMPASTPAISLDKFTTFGDLLKYLRRRAGLTQRELSIAVGYSDAQISRLEQNQRLPDPAIIEARFVPALFLEHEPQIVKRLMELAADVRREDAPALGLPPFKGLLYFDEADSDLFFGRETLTARLIERLAAGIEAGERFLAVVGASGSGKSSVVRAGLIPALRWRSPSASWPIHVLTPTARPLEALAVSLTQEVESVTAAATLADDLTRDSRSLQLFVKRSDASQVLLVVDQFEELFTLCRSQAEQNAFVNNLLTAAFEPGGSTIVVIALRADFYAHCADFADLRRALAQYQEYIGPMTSDELRRAIEEPARRGHWEFESGLIDLLLYDVGDEPGALPLLSHALLETWQRRRGRTLTLSGYLSSGGVRGAIAETAEAVFQDQLDQQQRIIARQIFLRLTELGEGTQDTRRRATLIELVPNPQLRPSVEGVLKTLADARLITTSEGVAEVAHEALIREWPTLRDWLADDREGLRLHRHLTEAAQEWERLDRDRDLLYRGVRLAQAVEWANTHADELNDSERAFLDASQALARHEEAEREAQRQQQLEAAQKLAESERQRAEEQTQSARQLRRRARYLTGAFIVALVMALAAIFFGAQARQTTITAQNERRIATARELAAAALNNLTIDPERSILLALQAVTTTRVVDGTVLPEAEEALHQSIVASPLRMTLTGHGTRVLSAEYSPDGKRLATLGDDGTTIVWDAATGEEVQRLPGTTKPSDFVSGQRIVYSPDGKLLAACDNGNVKVYDAATYKLLHTLIGHGVDMTAVAFSRDGARIASGGLDGTAYVWDAITGESLLELAGHNDAIEALTFSPDGKWLVTASDDATMKFWDAATGHLLRDYSDFTGEVTSVAFSPDGSRFAFVGDGSHVWQLDINTIDGDTTIASREIFTIPEGGAVFSPDGTQLAGPSASGIGNAIKVWDASTGGELMTLNGHTGWVMDLAFSPDSKTLASTSLDGTVKVWSLLPGNERVTVVGPGTGYGTRVAYHPNGQEFATNGGDGTATLWNAETGEPRLALRGHTLEALNVAFNSDGSRLATGSLDATAIVWETASGRKLLALAGHEFGVRDIAFSPDGRLIATGGFDGTAKVWDAATGSLIYTITDHSGLVLGVAFSPDGTRVATSSTDTTAKIRNARTGEVLLTLNRHSSGLPDIAYSPDGTKVATGSGDGTAIIWDAVTGSPLFTLKGHSAGIQSVAFNADGTLLATGSEDNTAKVWDVATGKELLTLPGSGGGVKGVAFSPADDGAHLAVSSADGVVRVFLLQTDELLALAQSRITRTWTTAECQQYLHVEECPAP
jgi:WD40 repeat protein